MELISSSIHTFKMLSMNDFFTTFWEYFVDSTTFHYKIFDYFILPVGSTNINKVTNITASIRFIS
jgi:hypothetical protein